MDDAAEDDDSILTTATNATTTSKAGKGRKKAVPKSKAKSSRGKKKASNLDSIIIATDPVEPEPEAEPVVEELVVDEPPKKQTRRKASRTVSSQLEDTIIASQSTKPVQRKASKSKAKQRVSDVESQLQTELQAAIESSLIEREETPKPKRGTKRTSDGMAKMDSSVVMLVEEPANFQELQDKPKRGRKPKAKAAGESQAEPRTSEAAPAPQRVSSLPKTGPKSRKGKKAVKPAEPEPEPEQEAEAEPEIQYPDLESEDIQMHDFAQSLVAPVNPYLPDPESNDTQEIVGSEQHTPEAAEVASPAPDTPTPARHSSVRIMRTQTPAKSTPARGSTPTPSPQSSDAENQPPSSRPSARPLPPVPQLAQRVPLADTTPDHANVSPSKRNMLNNITSAAPWSPTDLEAVFLASPVKANLALNSVALSDWDKENQNALDAVNLDKLDGKTLGEVVRRVRSGMSDAEKKMSVEEWVRWNAARGEERLKGECEGMVMTFEKVGGRALRTLEGIQCVE